MSFKTVVFEKVHQLSDYDCSEVQATFKVIANDMNSFHSISNKIFRTISLNFQSTKQKVGKGESQHFAFVESYLQFLETSYCLFHRGIGLGYALLTGRIQLSCSVTASIRVFSV